MRQVITPEARALIGKEGPPIKIEVEKHDIQKYAVAINFPKPPNPLYFDEEYGKKSKYGSIIAPPTFGTSFRWMGNLTTLPLPPYRVGMNGGNEYELYKPIHPGDVLTVRARIASLDEKPSGDNTMLIFVLEGNVVNERGEKVMTIRQTLLRMYPPETK